MKIFIGAVLSASLLLGACSKKLDINLNPVQPVTTTANLLLPGVQGNMSYHIYSQSRFSAYHSFYITSRFDGVSGIENAWDYNQITRLGAWRWHYFDVGSNANALMKRAELENSPNYLGVAKILMAFSFLTATDVFGDMPVLEAYTGDFSPSYDPQSVVYENVAKMLDEGIAALEASGPQSRVMDASSDLIYQGDLQKWKSFAHAVRARMLLHTANFQNNYEEVIKAADDALLNWGDAMFRYPENPQRDWDRNMYGPAAPNPQWNFADIRNNLVNSVHTDFFMRRMTVGSPNVTYDPRLYALTTPGRNGRYSSTRASQGLNPIEDAYNPARTIDDFASLFNGYYTRDNSPQPFILKEELFFIKAEAAFHLGRKDVALSAYTEGIKANLSRLVNNIDSINNYLASPKVKKTEAELAISDIMDQKYIALYLQPETWVDMRRYQYKEYAYTGIYYPKNALREFNGAWIQRFPYDPQTEYIYNPNEIERLGAKARNWVTRKVWWAENSKL